MKSSRIGAVLGIVFAGMSWTASARTEETSCYDLVYVPATVISTGSSSCVAEDDGFTISIPLPGGQVSITFGSSSIATVCASKIEEIPAHYERIAGEFEVRRTFFTKTTHVYDGCESDGASLHCKYKDFVSSDIDWILGDRCVAEESEYPHPEGL